MYVKVVGQSLDHKHGQRLCVFFLIKNHGHILLRCDTQELKLHSFSHRYPFNLRPPTLSRCACAHVRACVFIKA